MSYEGWPMPNQATPKSSRLPETFYLECSWCGGAAIRQETNWWQEDEGEACEDCGFPGHVAISGDGDDAHVYWWTADDNPAVVAEWVRTHPIAAEEFGYLEPEIKAGEAILNAGWLDTRSEHE